MKKVICYLLSSLFCMSIMAQSTLVRYSEQEQKNIIANISQTSKSLSSLTCDFTQEKTSTMVTEKSISKGKIYYKSPHSLRWEYTSPTKQVLIANNESVVLKNADGTIVEGANNKVFKELANMIIGTVNGTNLNDGRSFSAAVLLDSAKKQYYLVLTPISKRISAVYSKITLTIDEQTKLAKTITFNEVNGDTMKITFTNQQQNTDIDANLFNVK